jgi:hypothetical protein
VAAIEDASAPIACITLDNGSAQIKGIAGTATFLNDPGDVLTPKHVVEELIKIRGQSGSACTFAVYVPKTRWASVGVTLDAQYFGIGECQMDSTLDVAACHLQANPSTFPGIASVVRTIKLQSAPIADGTAIAFTGFPLHSIRPITSKGDIAARYISVDGSPRSLALDRNAWPGASGSAVYLADGSVVGIVIRTGISEAEGLAYALPTPDIVDFLTRYGFRVTRK